MRLKGNHPTILANEPCGWERVGTDIRAHINEYISFAHES